MLTDAADIQQAQNLLNYWKSNLRANCDLLPWEDGKGQFGLTLHDETGKRKIASFYFTTEKAANAALTFALDGLR